MTKNAFVLKHMGDMLDALTRGLPLDILTRGYGMESRNVMVSYQATPPTLGLVLPSNSPGVHTLWLPAIPLQIGLVLKPGSSEPWTPYRMYEAFAAAGVPREAFCLYPGPHDVGQQGSGDLQSSDDFRRSGNRRQVPRQSASPGARSGIQQDPDRRRLCRSAGKSILM